MPEYLFNLDKGRKITVAVPEGYAQREREITQAVTGELSDQEIAKRARELLRTSPRSEVDLIFITRRNEEIRAKLDALGIPGLQMTTNEPERPSHPH